MSTSSFHSEPEYRISTSKLITILVFIGIFLCSSWNALQSSFDVLEATAPSVVSSHPDGRTETRSHDYLLTKAEAASSSQRALTPIEALEVGMRVRADSPTDEIDHQFGSEVVPAKWRKLTLTSPKKNGTISHITLLRPLDWIQQEQAVVDGQVYISVPECGIDGNAQIHQIEPCPTIENGNGQVVTGTFRHQVDGGLSLQIEGEIDPILCTSNHPFWSEDQQDFVRADQLSVGDTLRTTTGCSHLEAIQPIQGMDTVFNIEVFQNHVYHVGKTGVLVHNGDVCPDAEKHFHPALRTRAPKNVGGAFEDSVKNTFRKKIIRQNEVLRDSTGKVIGEIDFETADALVEVGTSLGGKTKQLHKLAEIAKQRGKRLDVIYGSDTAPGTLRALRESLRKKFGNRVRFIPHAGP